MRIISFMPYLVLYEISCGTISCCFSKRYAPDPSHCLLFSEVVSIHWASIRLIELDVNVTNP